MITPRINQEKSWSANNPAARLARPILTWIDQDEWSRLTLKTVEAVAKRLIGTKDAQMPTQWQREK
jgi:hypothetical protein